MPSAASAPDASITAVLGPTNTGKTRLAIDRMLGRASGVIGLPLRLLAREVYDRVVEAKGERAAALVTGEEKIAPPAARYWVCTVEAMPRDREAAFVAVDEVQVAADRERGHVFTDRLLHARGSEETMLLGAETMRPMIRALVPEARHDSRERFSTLTHTGHAKLSRLPRRSVVVAFSAEEVYAIAEYLKRQCGGAAVVMGGLSPRTRNAQVALYQSGEVDYLVATDAIGMGLNMDVDHVAFASLRKFDGARRRPLRPEEIAQIAGRAGRFRSDGTFGTTGDCRPIPEDVAARIEAHQFDPVAKIQWRNADLNWSSLADLQASLGVRAPLPTLTRCEAASDETALNAHAENDELRPKVTSPEAVRRLWAACQIPDFRKTSTDSHVRLTGAVAGHLLGPDGVLPDRWIGAEIAKLDDARGEVHALATRLSSIRTWTYVANRSDWLADPEHWRGATRAVEDRLSDALHERLTQRFVDRRTSALMRSLRIKNDLDASVATSGDIVVEGHFVGRIDGLVFHPDRKDGELAGRALRAAALKAVRPEMDRRLAAVAADPPDAIAWDETATLTWRGMAVARLTAGSDVLAPSLALIGGELGGERARARAQERLALWLRQRIADDVPDLVSLAEAARDGRLTGVARGVAYRLSEALGAIDRRAIAEEVRALEPDDRKRLRDLGVRIGEHMVFTPRILRPGPALTLARLWAVHAETPIWEPPAGRTSVANDRAVSAKAYAAAGYRVCGPLAVRLDMLERLADLIREARTAAGAKAPFPVTLEMIALLGASREDLAGVLRTLGYRRAKTAGEDPVAEPELWRAPRPPQRKRAPAKAAEPVADDSPFAALAALTTKR